MNVLVLNAGSSNLKFQLIATDLGRITRNGDERLCRGQIERIGGEAIIAVHVRNGLKQTFTASLSDISGALEYLVRWIASDESGITEVRLRPISMRSDTAWFMGANCLPNPP